MLIYFINTETVFTCESKFNLYVATGNEFLITFYFIPVITCISNYSDKCNTPLYNSAKTLRSFIFNSVRACHERRAYCMTAFRSHMHDLTIRKLALLRCDRACDGERYSSALRTGYIAHTSLYLLPFYTSGYELVICYNLAYEYTTGMTVCPRGYTIFHFLITALFSPLQRFAITQSRSHNAISI